MEGDVIDSKNHFLISINGQIFSGCFPYLNDLYCKYSFVCGSDWIVISGVEEGISQISKKGKDDEELFVWNLPLSIIFKSTNPFGWPQLVISAYGLDVFGNEVVRGYGVCHVPFSPGHCEKVVPMFVPESSSTLQKFTSWLTGRRPEFIDPRILTQGDARDVATVRSQGSTKVVFDVAIKGFQSFGYRSS
ncbi:eppb9, putative [Pediculus humanus corporis]|uniref:B9 domain-containing protein 1 n=1 Tax=Pediculus humanus subsp. corporis TaxID=121224 RepID=E0VJZ8_PEDHC|nr:eppb9, putative [Pediculus humanus corporis]EEB13704.1 eppb9, putative [Pediculus humanus corporis]